MNNFCILEEVDNSTSLYRIWYSLFFKSNLKRWRFYCSKITVNSRIDVYCLNINIILFEDYSSIIIKQKENLARPRFELGSKAPKASMLGHYIRRNFTFLYRASGHIFVYFTIFRMLRRVCYKWEHLINGIIHTIKYMPRSILLSSSIVFV